MFYILNEVQNLSSLSFLIDCWIHHSLSERDKMVKGTPKYSRWEVHPGRKILHHGYAYILFC